MLVPKGTHDVHSERNATAVLAIMALSTFMALTAVLMILEHYPRNRAAGTASAPLSCTETEAVVCGLAQAAK